MNYHINTVYEKLIEIFKNVIDVETLSDKKILIIGCGEGYEILALRKIFQNVSAIEPNYKSIVEEAKPYVQIGDATNPDFGDENVDLVYSYHVLEHIPEYNNALSEMHRVLKKKGNLIFRGA